MADVVQGVCDARFVGVRDAFEANFAHRGEVGASVCVTVEGETVVDLWGGVADPATGREWERDTIGVVWSCTKGATALCAHILVSRNELDLDAPVGRYWPEFAKNGKDAITVRMMLAHQAGLAAFTTPIPDDGYCDWDLIVDRLADQEALWEPGTRHGYHALTFGHLVGEIVRRVTAERIGAFFRREVAEPLHLELWVGLREGRELAFATVSDSSPGAAHGGWCCSSAVTRESITCPNARQGGRALTPGKAHDVVQAQEESSVAVAPRCDRHRRRYRVHRREHVRRARR